MGVSNPVWEKMDLSAVTTEAARRLISGGFLSERDFTLTGFAEALFTAITVASRAKATPSETVAADIARSFLVEQVQNKDLPVSERREAARLLLVVTDA